jgi:hypothetical protein
MEAPVQTTTRPDFSSVISADGSIPDIGAFLRFLAKTNLYWLVATHGLDWTMVVRKIADDFIGEDRDDPNPLTWLRGMPDEYPEYGVFLVPGQPSVHFLRRDVVPAEVLAARFGVALSVVNSSPMLILKPTAEMARPDLPKPTVAGYGTA